MKHYIDFHEDVTIPELDALLDTAIDLKARQKRASRIRSWPERPSA